MDKELIQTKFGGTIREVRLSKSVSQEKLAQLAELDRSYMGKIERGEASPSLPTMLVIAEALNMKVSDLLKKFEKNIS